MGTLRLHTPYIISRIYLGLELLLTVEQAIPLPCLCEVAAGVGHGIVVIPLKPRSD